MAELDTRTRLELDWKHLPLGVIPTLERLASAKGLRLGMYIRTIVVEHALTNGEKK